MHIMLVLAVSSLMLNQLHILTANTKGEFVEAMWNMVGRTCP